MYRRKRPMPKRKISTFVLKMAVLIALISLSLSSVVSVNTESYVSNNRDKQRKVVSLTSVTKQLPAVKGIAADTVRESEMKTAVTDAIAVSEKVSGTVTYMKAGVLANGNTAGVIGTEAAARMAAATGVPQSTWEYIIARESNGDPTVANPSGASGLFQTMPGWGSTATVEEQISTAILVYNTQGLSAWGME